MGTSLRSRLRRGIRWAGALSIEAAEQACGPAGGRILEVGVGTGISGICAEKPVGWHRSVRTHAAKGTERVAEQG